MFNNIKIILFGLGVIITLSSCSLEEYFARDISNSKIRDKYSYGVNVAFFIENVMSPIKDEIDFAIQYASARTKVKIIPHYFDANKPAEALLLRHQVENFDVIVGPISHNNIKYLTNLHQIRSIDKLPILLPLSRNKITITGYPVNKVIFFGSLVTDEAKAIASAINRKGSLAKVLAIRPDTPEGLAFFNALSAMLYADLTEVTYKNMSFQSLMSAINSVKHEGPSTYFDSNIVLISDNSVDIRSAIALLKDINITSNMVSYYGTSAWNNNKKAWEMHSYFSGYFPYPIQTKIAKDFIHTFKVQLGRQPSMIPLIISDALSIANTVARKCHMKNISRCMSLANFQASAYNNRYSYKTNILSDGTVKRPMKICRVHGGKVYGC